MAKLISPVWSIIRGSIAGTTYLSGPNNTIIARQKTAPVNPGSEYQSFVREAMIEAAALWKEVLTPVERDDWALYASTLSPSGPLGPYKLTGQNAFLQSYISAKWIEMQGGTIAIDVDPPVIPGFLDTGAYTIVPRVNAGTGVQLNVVNYATEDVTIGVQTSGPWKESKNFYRGPWDNNNNQFFDMSGSSSSSFDVNTDEENEYYFFRIKAVTANPPLRTQSAVIKRHITNTIP